MPNSIDISDYGAVLIWCETFSAFITAAKISRLRLAADTLFFRAYNVLSAAWAADKPERNASSARLPVGL